MVAAADEPAGADDPSTDPATQRRTVRRSGKGILLRSTNFLSGERMVQQYVVRPWPKRRARRARWIALVFLVMAPVIATAFSWWGIAADNSDTLVEPVGREADSLILIDASAQGVDLERNEMTFRLVFRPSGEIIDRSELTDDVTVIVNDVASSAVRTFPAGAPMEPINVVVPMSGSQLLRYPFDTYDVKLQVGAAAGAAGDTEPLAIDLALDVDLDDFAATATTRSDTNSAVVDLELSRRAAVVLWVIFFMVLVWAIALGCAAVAWFLLIYAKEPPYWVFPFFAAILFALPTLRAGLPGNPPYGSLVDWAAFYWGIAIVAAGLVGLLGLWNIDARVKLRDAQDAHEQHESQQAYDRT